MKKNIELIKGLGIFLLYLLPAIGASLVSGFIKNENISDYLMTILVILELLMPIILIVIFRKTLMKDFKNFKENYKSYLKTGFKYWILGYLAMILFNIIIVFIINDGAIATNEELNRELLNTNTIFALISILVYAPITEELAFRASFKKAFKSAICFAIFTGFLFASLHVATAFMDLNSFKEILSNWKQILYIFPYLSFGFAFGYAYFKTDNIFTTFIVHLTHNFLTVLLMLLSFILPAV